MKGFHFQLDAPHADFWISCDGKISTSYIENWIGCIRTEARSNSKMFQLMLENSKFATGSVTAERLNNLY